MGSKENSNIVEQLTFFITLLHKASYESKRVMERWMRKNKAFAILNRGLD